MTTTKKKYRQLTAAQEKEQQTDRTKYLEWVQAERNAKYYEKSGRQDEFVQVRASVILYMCKRCTNARID